MLHGDVAAEKLLFHIFIVFILFSLFNLNKRSLKIYFQHSVHWFYIIINLYLKTYIFLIKNLLLVPIFKQM